MVSLFIYIICCFQVSSKFFTSFEKSGHPISAVVTTAFGYTHFSKYGIDAIAYTRYFKDHFSVLILLQLKFPIKYLASLQNFKHVNCVVISMVFADH